MPQLNKGGKFVFGLSIIYPDLTIHIPPKTLLEYDATRDGKVIIFTGSKITGGFCVTTYSLLSNSKLKHILEDCPALRDCVLSEGEFMQYKGRKYAWLNIDKNGVITVDDCVKVTNLINPILDSNDPIEENYILDVCSCEKGCE